MSEENAQTSGRIREVVGKPSPPRFCRRPFETSVGTKICTRERGHEGAHFAKVPEERRR